MNEFRLMIAEKLLGAAMSMAPPGSKERVEIATFVLDYFYRRLSEHTTAPEPDAEKNDGRS